jgi:hypothetical protein
LRSIQSTIDCVRPNIVEHARPPAPFRAIADRWAWIGDIAGAKYIPNLDPTGHEGRRECGRSSCGWGKILIKFIKII